MSFHIPKIWQIFKFELFNQLINYFRKVFVLYSIMADENKVIFSYSKTICNCNYWSRHENNICNWSCE